MIINYIQGLYVYYFFWLRLVLTSMGGWLDGGGAESLAMALQCNTPFRYYYMVAVVSGWVGEWCRLYAAENTSSSYYLQRKHWTRMAHCSSSSNSRSMRPTAMQCNAIQCDGVPSSFLLLMMMSISKHLAHVVSYIDTSKQEEEEEEVEKEGCYGQHKVKLVITIFKPLLLGIVCSDK